MGRVRVLCFCWPSSVHPGSRVHFQLERREVGLRMAQKEAERFRREILAMADKKALVLFGLGRPLRLWMETNRAAGWLVG